MAAAGAGANRRAMFRLAHISDIHLGPLPHVRKRDLVSKRITGYINWQRNRGKSMGGDVLQGLVAHMRAAEPDHIAVTGDLVNLALDAEVEAARGWLETVGPPLDVSVVPGNHDAYVPGALARVRRAWAPYMQGDDQRASATVRFPYVRRRGPVALIGVNSGRATAPFMSTGSLRSEQGHAFAASLRATRDAFRVVLIHHPVSKGATEYSKRLIGASRFRSIVAEEGADLVLHGHTHLATQNEIRGPDGPVPVIGVASASAALEPGSRKPAARYNLFRIEGAPGALQLVQEEWGYGEGERGVHKIAERTLHG